MSSLQDPTVTRIEVTVTVRKHASERGPIGYVQETNLVLVGSIKNGALLVYAPPECDDEALPKIAEALQNAGFARVVVAPPKRPPVTKVNLSPIDYTPSAS